MNIPLKRVIEIAFIFSTVGYITVGLLDYTFRKAAVSIEKYNEAKRWEYYYTENPVQLETVESLSKQNKELDSLIQSLYIK